MLINVVLLIKRLNHKVCVCCNFPNHLILFTYCVYGMEIDVLMTMRSHCGVL